MKTVLVICGTRPEAIKLAPVLKALAERPSACKAVLCVTAQHRELLDDVLRVFDLAPDYDLNLMRPDQHQTDLLAALLAALRPVIDDVRPNLVLVQGDTTTALAAALAAFHAGSEVAHVEAGLRTHSRRDPFPEEINRRLITTLADYHFAPTPRRRDQLLAEGVPPAHFFVTGNTVIDALLWTQARLTPADFPSYLDPHKRLILVTAHRRESFGSRLGQIALALCDIAEEFPDVQLVLPVHPNPAVRSAMTAVLEHCRRVTLVPPADYPTFVALLTRAHLILTDSGGVQEEAPALGKPLLVLREVTERPEPIEAGVARLVGTDRRRIVAETSRLLTDDTAYRRMARPVFPYGDGHAAERIVEAILNNAPAATQTELAPPAHSSALV